MTPSAAVDPRILHTRRVVVEATAELLTEAGFNQITIEAIAEKSGVARSTIYRNWPTRADLLVAGFEVLCTFHELPELGSLEAELRSLGAELANGLTHEAWGRVLPSLVAAAAADPELAEAQRLFSLRRREISSAAFLRAAARGDISSSADPLMLAEQFAAGFFFRKLVSHLPLDEEFVERQVTATLRAATSHE